MGALLWLGWFPDLRRPGADLTRGLAAAALAAALLVKLAGRITTSERRRSRSREMISDLEMGLLLLSATYVFLSVVGGVTAPLHPLVYALVSFLVTFHPLSVGCPLAAAALGFEGIMAFGPGAAPGAAAAFPGHAGFIAVFAVLNVAFLHAEVARQRRERRRCLEAEVASMREEARDFRLISSALSCEHPVRTRAEEEEKLSIAPQLFTPMFGTWQPCLSGSTRNMSAAPANWPVWGCRPTCSKTSTTCRFVITKPSEVARKPVPKISGKMGCWPAGSRCILEMNPTTHGVTCSYSSVSVMCAPKLRMKLNYSPVSIRHSPPRPHAGAGCSAFRLR